MNLKDLKKTVEKALKGKQIKGFYPSVSISETDFGTSYYIQNEEHKIRISDHSVTNFNRIINEEHFEIGVNLKIISKYIVKMFSNDYKTLFLHNGNTIINFHTQILRSDFHNWKVAKVWYKEEQYLPIKLEQIKNYEVLELGDLTKKKDKRFCIVNKLKCGFGAINVKTGEVIKTRFPFNANKFIEICKI